MRDLQKRIYIYVYIFILLDVSIPDINYVIMPRFIYKRTESQRTNLNLNRMVIIKN